MIQRKLKPIYADDKVIGYYFHAIDDPVEKYAFINGKLKCKMRDAKQPVEKGNEQ